jgi:predicted aspartyl protease
MGGIVERDVGWALVEYGGKRRVVPVIFGERGGAPVLGATSLEALGVSSGPSEEEVEACRALDGTRPENKFP